MTSNYQIKNTAGTIVSEIMPSESNGPLNKSVPRQILDVVYDCTVFSPAVDAIVLAGDLTTRFLQGLSFDVVDSGYAGTYNVSTSGSTAGDVVSVYANGNTYVPVSGGVNSPAFSIVGVEPGQNGRFYIANVANGHFTFLPSQAFVVRNNSFSATNDTYSVQTAETSGTYHIDTIDSSLQEISVVGDVARFFKPGSQFYLRGSLGGTADSTYTVATCVVNGGGNTVITVTNAAVIPNGTITNQQMVVTPTVPVTIVTVGGFIPLGATVDGQAVIQSLTAVPFAAPTTINSTATPTVSNVVYSVAGDYSTMFLDGAPLLVKQALVGGERRNIVVTVISTTFLPISQAYPSGLTQIATQYVNATATLPEIITDTTSSLVFPVLNLVNGYVTYSVPEADTPLQLVGRGAATYNETTSWGQALQENIVHVAENFAGTTPPIAPMEGMLWLDKNAQALRLKTGGVQDIVAVTPGNQGLQGFDVDGQNIVTAGDTLVVFNNAGYGSAKFTVVSASTLVTPSTPSGYTTSVVVSQEVTALAATRQATADCAYGYAYNLSLMKGVIVSNMAAIGDVDMGAHRITNAADPTAAQDLVTRSFADSRYVNVTGDTMSGALTMQNASVEVIDGTVHMLDSSSILFDSLGTGGISVQGSGSIAVKAGNITAGAASTNQVAVNTNGTAAPAIVFNTSSATTPTGNAVINLGTNKIINVSAPTASADVATKQYVDDRVNGIMWLTPLLDPNLFDDSLSAPPAIPGGDTLITYHRTYIVKAPGTGAWTGFNGHAMYYNGTAWVSVLGRPVAIGDRFGVFIEPDDNDLLVSLPAGGVVGQGGKIATVTAISPMAYSFYTPAEPDAVSVKGTSTGSSAHYGHSYTFRGTWGSGAYGTGYRWIEFAGPQMLVDGAGLLYTGNILNVGQGVGLTVSADTVALDTTYANANYVRRDGSSMTGALAMGNNAITGLLDAVNPQDAVNQRTGDARFVKLAGATMTGILTLSADPTNNLEAATKHYVDFTQTTLSNAKVSIGGDTMTGPLVLNAAPTLPLGAANKQYVDDADALRLLKTGGIMGGFLTLNADPSSALHAATKQYVDNNAVSKTVSTVMGAAINLTFATGGEVLGLPATPTVGTSATSKTYVDAQVALKATDTAVVHLAGIETITGAKTFNNTVTVAADAVNNNLVISSTNFTVSGKIVGSGAAYAIAVTAGQNNGGVGGAVTIAGGQGSTTGGGLSLSSGNGTTTGGNVTITSGTGAAAAQNGSITLTAGNAALLLDPRGVWYVNGLAPTASRQAIVSDPSAPTTASAKWTNIATRVAAAPVSSASAGVLGDWFADDNFFYVYGATGWRRIATTTF